MAGERVTSMPVVALISASAPSQQRCRIQYSWHKGSAGCFGLVGQESVDLVAEVSVGRVMNGVGASVYNQLKCLKVVSHVPEREC